MSLPGGARETGDQASDQEASDQPSSMIECSTCNGPFDIDAEGGAEGMFGMIPVAFCPTCLACLSDMSDQMWPPGDCPHCGEFLGDE